MHPLENNLNLIKSSTLLASIFDVLGLNYSVIDVQGDYIVQNNLSVSKISSGHMNAAQVDPATWEDCKNVMMKKKRTVIEEQFKERYYLSIKQPLYDNAHCLGILIVSHDITKEKQAEIAKQEFIMNMAHDLRTPFSGIVGLAQLQESGTLETPEEVKDYGKLIHESGNQLLEILNAVLVSLDKNEINVIKAEKLDLYEFSTEIQALIMPAIYLNKLDFALEVDPAIGDVFTDKIRLKQILMSLLSNAIKFTLEGKVILFVERTSLNNKQDKLKIKVSDTGIGIHKDHHKRIFEKFTKLKPSYESATFTGCGIGLYLVRKILNDLKGSITVKSELGKGSTFQIEIPLSKR